MRTGVSGAAGGGAQSRRVAAGIALALVGARSPERSDSIMEANGKRKKVLCPVEGKDGKTFWRTLGNAYVNRDASINVYLDALPANGKLQIRDWDERDERRSTQAGLDLRGGGSPPPQPVAQDEELPF
jgi:hypothetical protein